MHYILEVRDLVKKFGDFTAVDGLSFKVPRGVIYAFLGPNGAGKTTTLRMILGIIPPTRGDILIDGVSVIEHPEIAKEKIGYMPQYHSLYEDLTVYENLEFYASMYGLKDTEKLKEILEFVELWDFRNRLIAHLSGGMKQRASLACALVHDPQLLVLDEPTAGLDPVVRQKLWEYFNQLKRKGKTILVTTHYMDEASKADIIHLIRKGRTIMIGTLDEVIDKMFDRVIVNLKLTGDEKKIKEIAKAVNAELVEEIGEYFRVVLGVKKGSDLRPLLKTFLEKNVKILEISTHKPSLEEAFVFYATRGRTNGAE